MNRDYIREQEAKHKDWDRVEFAVKMVNEALEEVALFVEREVFGGDSEIIEADIRAMKV